MMKKWLAILCIITCVFAFAGCGADKTSEVPDFYEEGMEMDALEGAKSLFQVIVDITGTEYQPIYEKIAFYKAGIQSWDEAQDDIGECDPSRISNETVTKTSDGDYEVSFEIEGTKHNAKIVTVFEEEVDISSGWNLKPVSIATNVDFSSGELIGQAGLNTILGMGTTFVVLILLSLIISCFTIIPKLEADRKAKAAAAAAAAAPASAEPVKEAAAPAPAEAAFDDTELIAVIAAAIAASQGRETTDGLIVRSITKRGWKR